MNAPLDLLYVADPMCSWCYGFGPQLSRLLLAFEGARVELVMGGLRAYHREPMTPALREMLRGHWRHVAEASGQPFSEALIARDDFVYDTEPACRAVVAARQADPARALSYLEAVQSAFYRDARDVTRAEVLADIAADEGYDRGAFLGAVASDAMREDTRADFARAQSLGATGFPTLAVALGGELFLVAAGFATADVLAERIGEIARRVAARAGSAPGAA